MIVAWLIVLAVFCLAAAGFMVAAAFILGDEEE
jgi:hypothetical protein